MVNQSLILFIFISCFYLSAQTNYEQSIIDINNISFWISNNGQSAHTPDDNYGGFYTYSHIPVVYQDGIVWGGYVNDNGNKDLRIGGQTYRSGTQPGWIENGSPVAPDNERSRVYRIRKDWRTIDNKDVLIEAADLFAVPLSSVTKEMTNSILAQYKKDWYEWPFDLGAPYYDLNQNGTYDPDIDIAGLLDADQVIWFAVNDFDPDLTHNLYGSPPIGLEAQYTLWAYKNEGRLGQFFYKRVKLINKSGNILEDFYISQWSDPDILDASDDLVGCDSTTSLMYCYSSEGDRGFDGFYIPEPSIGYKIIQGPALPSIRDSALVNFNWQVNYKNLRATSFNYSAVGCIHYGDYIEDSIREYIESYRWYNILRGFIGDDKINNPQSQINNSTGQPTKFPLNGNPVTGTGDIDGMYYNCAASDRRMVLSTGPVNLHPNAFCEVVYAVVGGIGNDYIESITELKKNAEAAELYYFYSINEYKVPEPQTFILPYKFIFYPAYPNPFNPKTKIRYQIFEPGRTKINVYNMLGQRLAVLFDSMAGSGENLFEWDASSFSTGVYIIQIQFKGYSLLQKVLLIK